MPQFQTTVSCEIADSFRLRQVAGLFDLPVGQHSAQSFSVELPDKDEPWKIGLIVGPSGSGKSTIARSAFPAAQTPQPWPEGRAMVESLAGDIHLVTKTLAAVGFASPPAWLRPYQVLSGGEKFRADLARLLLSAGDAQEPVVMDEFTSVVDRTVARVGAAAVARAIRTGAIARRFVAVSCHYDILPWLCPDWCLDMATGCLARYQKNTTAVGRLEPESTRDGQADTLRQTHQPRRTRGLLCRPAIRLDIHRCGHELWSIFKRYHYLSQSLPNATTCYVGLLSADSSEHLAHVPATPVALAVLSPVAGFKGYRRFSRVVVLPDFQGIGIGGKFRDAVAAIEAPRCQRLSLVTSHPGMIRSLNRSLKWVLAAVNFSRPDAAGLKAATRYGTRRVCSYVWIDTRKEKS